MTEKDLKQIARERGWPEDAFISEVNRLIKNYGYFPDGALAEVEKHFAKRYGVKFPPKAKQPEIADFLPEKLMGKPGGAGVAPSEPPRPPAVGGAAGPRIEKPPRSEKKVEIDPEFAGWLSAQGFARTPEGAAYTKTVKVGEDVAKLIVNFDRDPRGLRMAYRLDLSKDPPEWRSDQALRDHPDLLAYKRFRDDLLVQRERAKIAPPRAKPAEVPTGEGTKLALLPPDVEEAREMERRDESMIINEIKGEIKERVLAQYFYDFTHQGRHIVGLSWAGVKAIIRKMGSIRIDELKMEEKKDGWLAICKAHDLRRNLDAVGVAYQPKRFPSGQENPFSVTVCASKAMRNCYRQFIEEKVVTEAYREWLKQRGGHERG